MLPSQRSKQRAAAHKSLTFKIDCAHRLNTVEQLSVVFYIILIFENNEVFFSVLSASTFEHEAKDSCVPA